MVRDCEWVENGWERCGRLATERRYPPGHGEAFDICTRHAEYYDFCMTIVPGWGDIPWMGEPPRNDG